MSFKKIALISFIVNTFISFVLLGIIISSKKTNYSFDTELLIIATTSVIFLQMIVVYKFVSKFNRVINTPIDETDKYIENFYKTGDTELELDKFPNEFKELISNVKRLTISISNLKHENQNIKKDAGHDVSDLERDLKIQKEATLKVLKEIDAEKELSEARAQELQKFQLAVAEASDHIVITNADGIILYTNKSGEKLTGYTTSEMLGNNLEYLLNKVEPQEYFDTMWRTLRVDRSVFKNEIINKKRDGKTYIAEINISPIFSSMGPVIFFVVIQRDITKAKEVDRMKTEFISLASHQLRAPLAAIRWGLETLLDNSVGPLNDVQTEFTKDAYDSTTRMVDLVNGLLNVSRIESGRLVIEPKPTNIEELVNSVIKEVRNAADERKQKLNFKIDENMPIVNIDPKLIRNVYLNFLTNAIKYTQEGGEISVKVIIGPDAFISEIKDNGYGIPKANQNRIFEKFYRADNIRKHDTDGTGLGLYLVKSIIETSNGKVWFESKENEGTTFWFSLPLQGMAAKQGEVSLE